MPSRHPDPLAAEYASAQTTVGDLHAMSVGETVALDDVHTATRLAVGYELSVDGRPFIRGFARVVLRLAGHGRA